MRVYLFSLSMMVLVLVAAGCKQESIDVASGTDDDAYGSAELLAAVQAFSRDSSPAGYRVLAQKVATSKPSLDEATAAEAERHLALLALKPLDALYDQPLDEQLQRLALTVWPTALGVEPKAGESADDYVERLCRDDLATHCKHVVPEYHSLVLGALVWTRFKERARLAVSACEPCDGEPSYAQKVARFEEREADMTSRAARIGKKVHPKQWPIAGAHAAPWSDEVPLVELRSDGTAVLGGEDLPAGAWDEALASQRAGAEVLGVAVAPSSTVTGVRALAQAAAAAGFGALAIQARVPEYPYDLRAYPLALGPRGEKQVQVRDIDSVQVLVQALDVAVAAGVALPSL